MNKETELILKKIFDMCVVSNSREQMLNKFQLTQQSSSALLNLFDGEYIERTNDTIGYILVTITDKGIKYIKNKQ